MNYCHSKKVAGPTAEAIRIQVEDALKTEGFGVLTVIDIQAVMKEKLNKDYLPHIILGACNAEYANKVLSVDLNMSTMLPCNVVIRELESGDIEIAAIDPTAVMGTIGNQMLEAYAESINKKLVRVLNSIN
jgi:uncharacterized protein (DUF302 family)